VANFSVEKAVSQTPSPSQSHLKVNAVPDLLKEADASTLKVAPGWALSGEAVKEADGDNSSTTYVDAGSSCPQPYIKTVSRIYISVMIYDTRMIL
jgi:hypothetical protein